MKKLVSVLLIFVFISSISFAVQSAGALESWVPGVKTGDWAKYDMFFGYNTTDPNPPISPPPPDSKLIEYSKLEVQSVVVSQINAEETIHYLNGTETSYGVSVDLMNPRELMSMTSSTPALLGAIYFIGANLSAGDRIYRPDNAPTINVTFMRTYAGASREVNYLNLSLSNPYSGYTEVEGIEFYWDRRSGIVDEIRRDIMLENSTNGYYTYASILMVMKETSIWDGVSPPPPVRFPGVKSGDWAKYAFSFNFTSNDPNPPYGVTPPPDNLDSYRLEIVSVAGTNVTFQVTLRYINGSENSTTDWLDVANGQSRYGEVPSSFLVAANLTAGDKIYLNDYAPTFNFTNTGMYASAEREVNHWVSVQSYSYDNQSSSMFAEFVWDRLTGMFVAVNENVTLVREGYVTQMRIRLLITETNIFAPTLTPLVAAEVSIVPKVINLKSQGGWIMAVMELPEDVKANEVDLSTIRINGTVPATGKAMVIGKRWVLVRFDRSQVIQFIKDNVTPQPRYFTAVTLTITVQLRNESTLQGSNKIIIMTPPSHSGLRPD